MTCISNWISDGEVTCKIRSGWHMGLGCRLGLFRLAALVSSEGKELVPEDRTAEGAAELILVQRVLGRTEEARCVDVVVADELEGRPVVLIRS